MTINLSSVPVYPLPRGFSWHIAEISPFTCVVAVTVPVLTRIPQVKHRWSSYVSCNFPELDEQAATDLIETVSDLVFARWLADYQRVRRIGTRAAMRLDLLRLKTTMVLTTAQTSWHDFAPADTAAAGAANDGDGKDASDASGGAPGQTGDVEDTGTPITPSDD